MSLEDLGKQEGEVMPDTVALKHKSGISWCK